MSFGRVLEVSAEIASTLAVIVAVLTYIGSARGLTNERRADFELDILKRLAMLVELAYNQPTGDEIGVSLRLLGYEEFPRLTAMRSPDRATPEAMAELEKARLSDGTGVPNDWPRECADGVTFQEAARREIDRAIQTRLDIRNKRWWQFWK